MNPERWKQVDSLFRRVLECPAEEREVRSLLAPHQKAGSFLENPAAEIAAQALAHKASGSSLKDVFPRLRETGTTPQILDLPAKRSV